MSRCETVCDGVLLVVFEAVCGACERMSMVECVVACRHMWI